MGRNKEKHSQWNKINYEKNKDKIAEKNEKNKERKSEYNKLYYLKNKEKLSETNKNLYLNNKEKIIANNCEYYKLNKEQYKIKRKDYRENNVELLKKIRKNWYINNKEHLRNRHYMKRYGITLDQYNEILMQQKGKCKICGIHKDDLGKNLVIDHSHINGNVRGLLCPNCNSLLGFVNDNLNTLTNAIDYLKNNN